MATNEFADSLFESPAIVEAYGTGGIPSVNCRHANGTQGTPTDTADGDALGRLYASGYNGGFQLGGYCGFAQDGTLGTYTPARFRVYVGAAENAPELALDIRADKSAVFSGPVSATQFKLSALNTAPANAGATGTLGEVRIDASYIYVCTATDTWKRAAIATWA